MKTQILILLMLITFLPQPTIAQNGCLATPNSCYDLDLSFAPGDVLTWVYVEDKINGTQKDYGVDSDGLLTLNLEVLQEFRGKSFNEVGNNWDDYFNQTFGVGDISIENETIGYLHEIHLVRPTLKVLNDTDKTVVNWFENVYVQFESEPYNYFVSQSPTLIYNLTTYDAIKNGLAISQYDEIRGPRADPSIYTREFHETRTNINTGIIEKLTDIYESHDALGFSEWKTVAKFDSGEKSTSIFDISENLVLYVGIFTILAAVIILLVKRNRKEAYQLENMENNSE